MLSNRWSVYHTSLGVISRMNEMYFIQIHGRSEDPGRVRKLVHHLLVLAAARSPYGVCVLDRFAGRGRVRQGEGRVSFTEL